MSQLPGSKDQKDSRYDSLEEYVWETQREKDDEIRITLRLEDWQRQAVQIVADNLSTQDVTVMNRAYNMGIGNVRDVVDEIEEISKFRESLLGLVSTDPYNKRDLSRISGKLDGLSIEPVEFRQHNFNISESPSALRLSESVISEARNDYTNSSYVDSSVDRYFIASGLTMSDTLEEGMINYCEDMEDAVGQAVTEARDELQRIARETVPDYAYKVTEDHTEFISKVEEIKEFSDGDCEVACEYVLDMVR